MSAIESVMQEHRVFNPPASFAKTAAIPGMEAYQALCDEAQRTTRASGPATRASCWHKPFTKVLDESNAPFYKWFEDGELNASYNCLDRNVEKGLGDKTAIFEADDGTVTRVSYQELLAKVSRFANG
jgi:acetyl-CoA synthetase